MTDKTKRITKKNLEIFDSVRKTVILRYIIDKTGYFNFSLNPFLFNKIFAIG